MGGSWMDVLPPLVVAHRQAAAAGSPYDVVQVLARAARAALAVDASVVSLWDPQGQVVRCTAADGLDPDREPAVLRAVAALADDIEASWLVLDDMPRTFPTGAGPAAVSALTTAAQLEAATLVPLSDGGRSFGALVLLHAEGTQGRSNEATAVDDVRRSLVAELDRVLRIEQVQRQAHFDAVTELPGEALFTARTAQALASRVDDEVGVLLVWVDQLDTVSRSLGPTAGNELLRKVADRLLVAGGAAAWLVARLRFGGFGVLVRGRAGICRESADQLVKAFAQPLTLGRRGVRPTVSVGFAVGGSRTESGSELVQRAQTALHEARASVRSGAVEYDPSMTASAQHLLGLEAALQLALTNDELTVHYQPQVDVRTGGVVGAEALVRWQRGGVPISPATFLPAAEVTGMIVDIDQWVLARACRQVREWLDAGLPQIRMAVNVSSRTLAVPGYAEAVLSELAAADIDPRLLEVEVTETAEWTNADTVDELDRLQAAGVHIAIDDFGTGYSTVGRLRALPIERVKIDQSFVRDMAGDGAAICEAVLAMARSLDLDVIAEGVETADQLEFLSAKGCRQIQGYLVSPPVDAATFATLTGLPRQRTAAEAAEPVRR